LLATHPVVNPPKQTTPLPTPFLLCLLRCFGGTIPGKMAFLVADKASLGLSGVGALLCKVSSQSAVVALRTRLCLGGLRAVARNVGCVATVVANFSLLRGGALPADVASAAAVITHLPGSPATSSTTAAVLGDVSGLSAVVANIVGRGSAASGRGAVAAEMAQTTASVALLGTVGVRRRSRGRGCGGGDGGDTGLRTAARNMAWLATGVAEIVAHLLLVGALGADVTNFAAVVASLSQSSSSHLCQQNRQTTSRLFLFRTLTRLLLLRFLRLPPHED